MNLNRMACLLVLGLLGACGGGGDAGNSGSGTSTSTTGGAVYVSNINTANTATVTYSVTGTTNRANLTYENSDGGTAQETVSLPWSKTYIMKADDFLYISAQNDNASGSVTARIYINGATFKTTTSSGAYVIATAFGSCC